MLDKKLLGDVLVLFAEKYGELKHFEELHVADKLLKLDDFRIMPPTRIYLEPTNNCNLNCRYCARCKMTRDVSFMSVDTFKKAIRGLPRGTNLVMVGNGEPLLNKHIYDMIALAKDEGYVVVTITNGTLLTEKNSLKLIESGVNRVQISFDAVDKKVYEDIVRSKVNSFENVLKKIIDFIYLARIVNKSNVFITISSVLTNEVKNLRDVSLRFWDRLPIDNYYEGPLLTAQTDSGLYEEARVESEEWKMCSVPWTALKVNADGTVNGCIFDYSSKFVVGNVSDASIKEIVNSKESLEFRQAHYMNNQEYLNNIGYHCGKCNSWTSHVGNNIYDYRKVNLPITYGIMINEISNRGNYPDKKLHLLKNLHDNFSLSLVEEMKK